MMLKNECIVCWHNGIEKNIIYTIIETRENNLNK